MPRKILASVTARPSDPAVLEAVASLVRRFEAHADVLFIRPDPRDAAMMYGFAPGLSAGTIELMMESVVEESDRSAAQARQTFDAWRARYDLPLSDVPSAPAKASVAWVEDTGNEARVLSRRGRLADLIVTGRPLEEPHGPSLAAVEAAFMETGRPVLIVPADHKGKSLDAVAVAWNGSLEASRAVALAMPLLLRANRVTVISVEEPDKAPGTPDQLADYLGWHGIEALVETVPSQGDIGEDILTAAGRLGADLLVMGAYTHSRLREIILGGVTRHVLDTATIPVLMAH